MDITLTREIAVPPLHLWAWLTEPDRIREWNPSVIKDEPETDGLPGPGFVSQMTIKEGRGFNTYRSEILSFVPCEFLEMSLSGGNLGAEPMVLSYAIAARGEASVLTYRTQWAPKGVMLVLLYPLIVWMSRRNVSEQIDVLKRVAERGTPPA